MPTDRKFTSDESSRRISYEHTSPKDSNFNPENSAVKVARGLNAVSRATGMPYNKGAVGVQSNADMIAAEQISDAVPRRK